MSCFALENKNYLFSLPIWPFLVPTQPRAGSVSFFFFFLVFCHYKLKSNPYTDSSYGLFSTLWNIVVICILWDGSTLRFGGAVRFHWTCIHLLLFALFLLLLFSEDLLCQSEGGYRNAYIISGICNSSILVLYEGNVYF